MPWSAPITGASVVWLALCLHHAIPPRVQDSLLAVVVNGALVTTLFAVPFAILFLLVLPRRGAGGWRWTWIPLAVAVASLWTAGPTWETARDLLPIPCLAPFPLLVLGGALRRARSKVGDVSTLDDASIRAAVGAGALLLLSAACSGTASTASLGFCCFQPTRTGDHGAWPTLVAMPFALAFDAAAALGLAGVLVGRRATHRRLRAALLPGWGVVAIAAGRAIDDGLSLVAARQIIPPLTGQSHPIPTELELLGSLSELSSGTCLVIALAVWSASLASISRASCAAWMGWRAWSPVVVVALASTATLFAPSPFGWCQQIIVRSSAELEPLVRDQNGEAPQSLGAELLADGTVVGLGENEGQVWPAILPDRRVTMSQLIQSMRRFRGPRRALLAWRRHDLDAAPTARERWAFVEAAGRATAGRELLLVSDVDSCEPVIVIAGAEYQRCAAKDPTTFAARVAVLVLRDPAALTVGAWLDSIDGVRERVALDWTELPPTSGPLRLEPRENDLRERVGFSQPGWAWLGLLLGPVALLVATRRPDHPVSRLLARELQLEVGPPLHDPNYREASTRPTIRRPLGAHHRVAFALLLTMAAVAPSLLAHVLLLAR